MQKGKTVSEEASQIAEKRRDAKNKGEKERYTHLKAEFQGIARRDKKAILTDLEAPTFEAVLCPVQSPPSSVSVSALPTWTFPPRPPLTKLPTPARLPAKTSFTLMSADPTLDDL